MSPTSYQTAPPRWRGILIRDGKNFNTPARDRRLRRDGARHALQSLPPRRAAAVSELPVYSVSELNREAKLLLREQFGAVLVEGEVSRFSRHRSGHWYFTLKDGAAAVDCAMFRTANRRLRAAPEVGDAVQARARVDLYEVQGRYQLNVEDLRPQGAGDLLRRFEELKARLRAEGLFDPERRRPLPACPRVIGVVTSPGTAAFHDVERALRRRWPLAQLLLYPSPVQGREAPGGLVAALERAGREARCDVLLLVRGGGGPDDLQAFSEEPVVRAVAACPLPLVTGIGHETDVALADFAADARAATPTAAAELASPDQEEVRARCARLAQRLRGSLEQRLARERGRLDLRVRRLERAHPAVRIQSHQQRLDELSRGMARGLRARGDRLERRLHAARARLRANAPRRRLETARLGLALSMRRLRAAAAARQQARQARLRQAAATLEAVRPQRILARGYAIARLRGADGRRILRDAAAARPGDALEVELGRGAVDAEVTRSKPSG